MLDLYWTVGVLLVGKYLRDKASPVAPPAGPVVGSGVVSDRPVVIGEPIGQIFSDPLKPAPAPVGAFPPATNSGFYPPTMWDVPL